MAFIKNRAILLIAGLGCIIFAEIFPFISSDWTLLLLEGIRGSIETSDSGKLTVTAFSYIGRGLIIFYFIYMGSMLITMFFEKDSTLYSQMIFFVSVIISIVFYNVIHFNEHSLLTHFFMVLVTILLMNYVPRQKYFLLLYSVILMQIILSVQWLNLIPSISYLGFGKDDLSTSIKVADEFLTSNTLLNIISITFFVLFLFLAVFFTLLISNYTKQIHTLKKYQKQERELKDARLQIVESRVMKEIHTLVHDIKSPLVTVEGLTSLLAMMLPEHEKVNEYINKIERSLNKMKDMISEILYEDERKSITVKELLDYSASHTIIGNKKINFSMEVSDELPRISINKIRFARAITNVLENSIVSIGDQNGYIHIQASKTQDGVQLLIRDNGRGIPNDHLESIWEEGFSTKKSSGLGLSFVKRVVENHGGTVSIQSQQYIYTVVKIFIPEEEGSADHEENGINN